MIRVRDLSFGYPNDGFTLSVDDLQVARGESTAMVGPSGSGKTTLLHLLAGILAPAKGSVVIDDVEVAELGREDRQDFRALSVGLVFQEFELLEYLTVPENILLPYRVSPALTLDDEAGQRAMELIGQVGLAGKKNSYPGQLSQGERQRVAVCRSLVTLPKVLFGDEPTANLDSDNRDQVMDALFRYSEEHGAPLVVVTHDRELHGRFHRVVDVRELAS